jgi:hypothetical protein
MKKLILYTAASLDNFIARLMGNKTHQFILDQDVPFPYSDRNRASQVYKKGLQENYNEGIKFRLSCFCYLVHNHAIE